MLMNLKNRKLSTEIEFCQIYIRRKKVKQKKDIRLMVCFFANMFRRQVFISVKKNILSKLV